MERRTFEDSFRDAFRGAGMSPTESVWTNIELALERAEGKRMKRSVFFYKVLAAASVAFALTVAGIGYYTVTSNNLLDPSREGQLAQVNSNETPAQKKRDLPADHEGTHDTARQHSRQSVTDAQHSIFDRSLNEQKRTAQEQRKHDGTVPATAMADATTMSAQAHQHAEHGAAVPNGNVASGESTYRVDEKHPVAIAQDMTNTISGEQGVVPGSSGAEAALPGAFRDRELPELYTARIKDPSFEKETSADPVALMFAKLEDLERELASQGTKKEQAEHEKLWTSVGFAAGGFNAVNSSVSSSVRNNTMAARDTRVASKQASASGIAYSMGVSFGTQLSSRWVIQGGVNYLTQESDYTANQAVGSPDFQNFKAASLNEFRASADAENNKIVSTAPYSVNNSVRFISVPMQAGYLLINRKVALQLNAGVSTDLFLQNTIDPEGGGLERTTQGRGDDSPYRSFNFSGLLGTELSYKFSSRYRVALNPGLRYPFNSIYKEDSGVDSTPLTFDLGLRFRYIFK